MGSKRRLSAVVKSSAKFYAAGLAVPRFAAFLESGASVDTACGGL